MIIITLYLSHNHTQSAVLDRQLADRLTDQLCANLIIPHLMDYTMLLGAALRAALPLWAPLRSAPPTESPCALAGSAPPRGWRRRNLRTAPAASTRRNGLCWLQRWMESLRVHPIHYRAHIILTIQLSKMDEIAAISMKY